MADNATWPPTGLAIAADNISSVLYQRIKPAVGADGAAVDVSAAAPMPVYEASAGTVASASVTSSSSSVEIFAAGAGLRGRYLRNDSGQPLYLSRGSVATTASPWKIAAGGEWRDIPCSYSGAINGIWASADGFARTEALS